MLLLYMSFCVRVTHFITIDRPTIVNKAVIVASRSVDYDCDCVAFVLLSHGEDEGMIHGTDNVVAIDSLLKPLKHEDNMKHFAGKPKVVFVQVITALSLSLFYHRTYGTTSATPPLLLLSCLGSAVVRRRTRDRKVAGSTPGRGAIKSTRSTQPSITQG